MPAAVVSDLTMTPRPRHALAAAHRGDRARGGESPETSHVQTGRLTGSPTNQPSPTADGPEPAAPAASIAVTVHIDLHGGAIPPAVAGLIDSLRGLAGSTAVSVAPSAGSGVPSARPDAGGPSRADARDAVVIPGAWGTADPGAAARLNAAAHGGAERIGQAGYAGGNAYGEDAEQGEGVADGEGAAPVDQTGRGPAEGPTIWARPRPVPDDGEPGQVVQPLRIFLGSRVVLSAGAPVRLTRREYDLLAFLCQHPRRVFSRPQLLHQVWGYEMVSGARTVDVHVRRLRAKLGERGPLIATVRGVGYRLDHAAQVTVVAAA